jgi:3-phenylpropionate/cinnamic acid dioxygenase small subunit
MSEPTRQQLIDFVFHEARLLDEARYDEWNALFTDDAIYWVPLAPDQPEGLQHTSHLYEDKLLRDLRVERLRSPRAFSQQPASRSHHLLQMPSIERFDPAANRYITRAQFHYTEFQNDEVNSFVGTVWHQLCVLDGALKLKLKRVNLLNSDAALPAVQLFI